MYFMVLLTNFRVGYVGYLATRPVADMDDCSVTHKRLCLLQSPSESGITSRYFTVDSIVCI